MNTDSPTFRRLADELVTLLAYEATRDVRVEPSDIVTPVAPTTGGVKLATPKPLVVPILRAGLGMLDGMMRLLPTAEVGFLGMVRNEETLEASTYAERLPDDLSGRQCYVLDPMLATGGTLAAAIRFLTDRGADHITAICLLAAPEGCERLSATWPGSTCRSRSSPRRWTRSSTRRATSCPGWATRATGCTASPADRCVAAVGSQGLDRVEQLAQRLLRVTEQQRGPGSKSSSFSMPANPGRIDRFMNTTCFASSALRIGMP